jgi:hypothetical protein
MIVVVVVVIVEVDRRSMIGTLYSREKDQGKA